MNGFSTDFGEGDIVFCPHCDQEFEINYISVSDIDDADEYFEHVTMCEEMEELSSQYKIQNIKYKGGNLIKDSKQNHQPNQERQKEQEELMYYLETIWRYYKDLRFFQFLEHIKKEYAQFCKVRKVREEYRDIRKTRYKQSSRYDTILFEPETHIDMSQTKDKNFIYFLTLKLEHLNDKEQ